jgi:plastocyanin
VTRRLPARAAVFVAVAGALATAGCGGDAAPSGSTGSTLSGDPAEATVVIDDVAFENPDVRVAAGGVVTFDNRDSQAHTATGADRSFDTGTVSAGGMKDVTFDEPGTYSYICSFHPFMKGTVTVS